MTQQETDIWETKAWIARYTCVTPVMVDEMTYPQLKVFRRKLQELIKAESGGGD